MHGLEAIHLSLGGIKQKHHRYQNLMSDCENDQTGQFQHI